MRALQVEGAQLTSVVLVHGTGVRADRYTAWFERVQARLAHHSPDVTLLPCRWGDQLGSALHAGGVSIPDFAQPLPGPDESRTVEAEWPVSQWLLLEADPLHELRLAALTGATPGGTGNGLGLLGEREGQLADRAAALAAHPAVVQRFRDLGLSAEFEAAVPAVLLSDTAGDAFDDGDLPELAPLLGRAVLADVLRRTAADDRGAVPILAADRARLVALMTEVLGGAHLGPLDRAWGGAKSLARLAWRLRGSDRRNVITEAAHPFAGDIMLYLVRGERIRRFIEKCCRDAEPPVVLLGHSLGGIAALDLLASRELPMVRHLVTVGSQGPLLYELGALPSLAFGEELPASVPAWTNFYDPRDLLSYVGEAVFPGRVTDICVPSGNGYQDAHGDYFGNPAFYEGLDGIVG